MANRLQQYQALPKEVQTYLFDASAEQKTLDAMQKHQLDQDTLVDLLMLAEDVVLGSLKLEHLMLKVQERLQVDDQGARDVTRDLIGYRLVPLEAFVPDVEKVLSALGTTIGAYQGERVKKREVTPQALVKEVLKAKGAVLPDAAMQNRLEFILANYVRGVRTAEQTVQVIGKSSKVGGLDLAEPHANRLIAMVDERKKYVVLPGENGTSTSTEPKKEVVQKPVAKKSAQPAHAPVAKPRVIPKRRAPVTTPQTNQPPAPQSKPVPPPPTPAPAPVTKKEEGARVIPKRRNKKKPVTGVAKLIIDKPDEDAADLAKARQQLKTKQLTASSPEDAVKTVEHQAGLKLSPDLQKRFQTVVGMRMRDLRNSIDTKAHLEKTVEQGGLGLRPEEAKRVSMVIETVYQSSRSNGQDKLTEQKQAYVKGRLDARQEEADWKKKEDQLLAKRYAAMTGKVPEPVAGMQGGPSARTSAATDKKAVLEQESQKVDPVAKAVLRQSAPRPEPVLPKLSPGSIPPGTPGKRPNMSDVKYTQKLIGPVEELKTMDLVQFRRLSSDPTQATTKILDKVDLLQEESYEQKIAGVSAWKASPVNQLYVHLSSEALRTGKTVVAVAEEEKQAGKPTLTEAEIHAIMKLNTALRF